MAKRSDSLHIRRHNATYRVPRSLGDPTWHSKLDGILLERLSGSLEALLKEVAGDGVWLIRSLAIHSKIGTDWDDQDISDQVAREIALEIGRVLEEGANGTDVLWFPNRIAFLSRFLADCAEGRAKGRWEYAQFESWLHLSTTAIVREVVAASPEDALGALLNVLPGELKSILRQVFPQDADSILRVLAGAESSSFGPFPILMDVVRLLLEASEIPSDPRRAALAIFLHAARQDPRAAGRECERLARDVGQFTEVYHRLSTADAQKFYHAIEKGEWSGLPALLGGHRMAQIAGLLSWPKERLLEVVELFTQTKAPRFKSENPVGDEPLYTRFGGMFLLLPLLEEFPWTEATAGWPDFGDIPAARMVKYLTMIGALGQPRNPGAATDAALRLALGIEGGLESTLVAAWARSIPSAELRRFRQVWLNRLLAHGKILMEEVALANHSRMALAIDQRRGIWIGAAARQSVAGMRAELSEISEEEPVWLSEGVPAKLAEEIAYASLSPAFALPALFRRLTMLTAQNLLREFAWRVPGFSKSSLPHLFENFLNFPATVQQEEERYLVHMQNPPLHLVLSLTGMNRKQFRLEATGGKEWLLAQAP